MKLSSVLGRLVLVFAGVCFAGSVLVISLSATTKGSIATWVITPLFLIVFIELTLNSARQAIAIRNDQVRYDSPTLASQIGRASQPVGAMFSIIVAILFLGMLGFILLMAFKTLAAGQGISVPFIAQVSVYGSYMLVRVPLLTLLRRVGTRVGGAMRKSLPSYRIVGDGILLDLAWRTVGHPDKKRIVSIGFSEIEEMRALTFAEAQAFQTYSVGPDFKLAMQQTKGMYDYLKGTIPRPTVLDLVSSNGLTLFLKGPSLFYLLTVGKTDVSDLLNAYASFRSAHRVSA